MTDQLSLLPSTGPEVRREQIPLERIDGFADAAPSAKLRELIRDLGLLQAIVVVPSRKGRYRIVEGRRRTKAVALLAEAGEWPTPPLIDALVIASTDARREEIRGGLTLALHATRSPSPASELRAIEAILDRNGDRDEATTVKEIAAQTGISVQTVRRRLRLRSLIPVLRAEFDRARMSAGVAEAAARLPEARQQRFTEQLTGEDHLSLARVRDFAREKVSAATNELPGELFGERDVAWQTTVRGHLQAALTSVPEGEHAIGELVRHAIAGIDAL